MIVPTKLPLINLVGAKGAGKDTIHEAIIRLFLPRSLRQMTKEQLIERYHHHPPRVKLVKRATERKRRHGEEGSWKSPGSWVLQFFESEEFSRLENSDPYGADRIIGWTPEDGREVGTSMGGDLWSKDVSGGDYLPDILPYSLKWVSDNGVPARSGVLHPRHYPEPDEDTLFYLAILADSTQAVMPWISEYFPNTQSFFLDVQEDELSRRLANRSASLGLSSIEDHLAINETYLASHPQGGCIVISNQNRTPKECAIEIARIVGLSLPAKVLR